MPSYLFGKWYQRLARLVDISPRARINDKEGFISAMMGIRDKMSEIKGQGGPQPYTFADATISDIKVEGDKATGMVHSEGSISQKIHFEKIDGNWLINFNLND